MRKLLLIGAGVSSAIAAAPAFATPAALDYSGITGAIDLDSTVTAIVAVGGLVAVVAVAVMGVRKVLRMIR